MRQLVAPTCLALALAACSGGGGSTGVTPSTGGGSHPQATVQLKIVIPPKSTASKPQYVSPSTTSISVAVDGGTATTVNLAPSSSNCTTPAPLSPLTCTVPILASAGTHSFTFVTYDANGSALSQNTVSQTIVANQVNNVNVTLAGVPASISVFPLTPASGVIQGEEATGFTMTDGAAMPINVVALDSDGNAIVGPGAPTITPSVTGGSPNANNFTVASGTSSNPNVFTITSADLNNRATLTLSAAVPGGGAAVTASIPLKSHLYVQTLNGSLGTAPLYGLSPANGKLLVYNQNSGAIESFDPASPAASPVTLATPGIVVNQFAYDSATQRTYAVSNSPSCTISYLDASNAVTSYAGAACGSDVNGTGSSATFYYPGAMAEDASGNLFVAEAGGATIREVTSGGVVSTVAGLFQNFAYTDASNGSNARLENPSGITFDPVNGKFYIADGCTVRSLDLANSFAVTTIAGSSHCGAVDGTGSSAKLEFLTAITFDAADGTLYALDENCRLARITTAGVVTTVAGESETCNVSATDGFAPSLRLIGLTFNPSDGTLYDMNQVNVTGAQLFQKVIL